MPIVTRSTVDEMKSQGISSMGDDEVSEKSAGGGNSNEAPQSADRSASSSSPTNSSDVSDKRLRETPSCMDSVATDAKSMTKSSTEAGTSKKKPSSVDRVSSSKSKSSLKSKSGTKSSSVDHKAKSTSADHQSTAHSKSSQTSLKSKSRTESSKTSLKSKSRPKSSQTSLKSKSRTKSSSAGHKSKSRPKSSKTSLKSKSKTSPPKSKKSESESGQKSQDKGPFSLSNFQDYTKIPWSKKKYLYVLTLLKSATKNFNELTGAEAVTGENGSRFAAYKVDKSKQVNKPHSCKAIYEAIHKDFGDCPMVCKLYDADRVKPDSHYLKMLLHLGKKHPCVMQTWDVFVKDDLIYLFQEIGFHGNMSDYVATKGPLDETKAKSCAMQIYQAMEFLGDMAVCHRAIKPSHILLCHADMRIKLTGFREAIIYWGIPPGKKEPNVLLQSCVPLDKRSKTEPDYQAPEIFGDPSKEEFDPICADVWSMGASIYYLLTGKYPYCFSKENPNIEQEIHKNVRQVKVHDKAHNLLAHCLTVYSNKRLNAAHLGEHPWLRAD